MAVRACFVGESGDFGPAAMQVAAKSMFLAARVEVVLGLAVVSW
jgi:hypothetical protein